MFNLTIKNILFIYTPNCFNFVILIKQSNNNNSYEVMKHSYYIKDLYVIIHKIYNYYMIDSKYFYRLILYMINVGSFRNCLLKPIKVS